MRYISHEMRTPLNSAFLGLRILESEVQDMGTAETVLDVKDSCNKALDTLNELLLYDKLESGSLKLDVETVLPWQLIRDVVRSFQLQVRHAPHISSQL